MTKKATRMGAAKTVVAATGLVAVFGAAAGVAAPVAAETSAPTSVASTSAEAPSSTVRKSVTMSGDADGTINSTAMVTQVSAVGDGNMTVNVPIGTDSVRNLDGFGSVPVENNDAVFNLDVNGSEEQRTYSTATQDVLSVQTKVTLDGKPIDAKDVVGKTGLLDVEYTVVNSGKSKQTVTYQDAAGNTITQEEEVDLPIGGSVDITLPQGFNEITAKGASIGGNGTGGTKLSYSLVLFAPLGDPVSSFSYQTRITEGTLPEAEFTFLPIVPLDNPSVVTAKTAFTGGAQVGTQIYDAGTEISENLLKLQDGAAQLLAGLETASSGASELANGLTNTAVPGAKKLEDGAGQLAAGLNGPDGAAAGSEALAAGLNGPKGAAAGSAKIAAGLASLQLAVNKLPATVEGQLAENEEYQYALSALNIIANGGDDPVFGTIPSPTQAKTAIAGLYGVASLNAGCDAIVAPYTCAQLKAVADGYIDYASGVAAVLGPQLPVLINTVLLGIQASLLGTEDDPAIDVLTVGSSDLAAGLAAAAPGSQQLADGLADAASGSQQLADGTTELADGLVPAAEGATTLADGLPAAVDGIAQAEQGAVDLREQGSEKLAATGKTAQQGYAEQVGQINALQQVGAAGENIPYGPATASGGPVVTSGVYQLTLAAAPSGSSNGLVFGLAALGLIAGGAVGVWAYRRRTV